jgi:ferredoxin
MKIVVNWALCEGNSNCAKEAPELFAIDADGNLLVLKETLGEQDRAKAAAAVQSCPKHALRLVE